MNPIDERRILNSVRLVREASVEKHLFTVDITPGANHPHDRMDVQHAVEKTLGVFGDYSFIGADASGIVYSIFTSESLEVVRTALKRALDGVKVGMDRVSPEVGVRENRRGESSVREAYKGDEQSDADELVLFITNDRVLYDSQYISIVKNLMRKRGAGVYDHEQSLDLWMYLVDAGAKKYAKEIADDAGQPWHIRFPKGIRREAARILADEFDAEAKLGNWDHYMPKKYQKKAQESVETGATDVRGHLELITLYPSDVDEPGIDVPCAQCGRILPYMSQVVNDELTGKCYCNWAHAEKDPEAVAHMAEAHRVRLRQSKAIVRVNGRKCTTEKASQTYHDFTIGGTQNDDGTWDFDGDVYIANLGLTELPIRFGRVSGNFFCSHNQLTSLDGAPESVGGNFFCSHNQLTSLDGAPESVGGGFICFDNQLTSLDGAPESVGGDFYCFSNQLTSLDGAPESVGGNFDCSYNQLTSLDGAPESVGDNFDCSYNQLTSLDGAPESVGGNFYCSHNPDLPSEEIEHYKASGAVRGRFYESRKHFRRVKSKLGMGYHRGAR